MRNVAVIVQILYAHQSAEKLAPVERSLKKAVVDFYHDNKANGTEAFYSIVENKSFFEELLNFLPAAELKKISKEVDPGFNATKISAPKLRDAIIRRVVDHAPKTDDTAVKAKAALPALKACKDVENLKDFRSNSGETLFVSTIRLLPAKTLRTFVKRFDKYNPKISEAEDSALLHLLERLASGEAEPLVKPKKGIPSAAAKAKWSGKEPD